MPQAQILRISDFKAIASITCRLAVFCGQLADVTEAIQLLDNGDKEFVLVRVDARCWWQAPISGLGAMDAGEGACG